MRVWFFALLLVAIFCGCASNGYRSGQGDAGRFILQQAIAGGGHPVATNNLPAVNGRWRYSPGDEGVVIRLPPEEFSVVEAPLKDAFGKPSFGPIDKLDGGKLVEYRLTSKGGGIQLASHVDYTQVLILRPLGKNK